MAGELNNFQYYGLVGQAVSQATASMAQGFGGEASNAAMAGGYASSAAMMDIEAEQALINAEGQANNRMDMFNQGEAANAAVTLAQGKTLENTTISDANRQAAEKDVSLMRRQGRMNNISARSGASAARSSAKQAKIAGNTAMIQGIFGGVSGVAMAGGQYSMIKGN